jgi:hypothetical protein
MSPLDLLQDTASTASFSRDLAPRVAFVRVIIQALRRAALICIATELPLEVTNMHLKIAIHRVTIDATKPSPAVPSQVMHAHLL